MKKFIGFNIDSESVTCGKTNSDSLNLLFSEFNSAIIIDDELVDLMIDGFFQHSLNRNRQNVDNMALKLLGLIHEDVLFTMPFKDAVALCENIINEK